MELKLHSWVLNSAAQVYKSPIVAICCYNRAQSQTKQRQAVFSATCVQCSLCSVQPEFSVVDVSMACLCLLFQSAWLKDLLCSCRYAVDSLAAPTGGLYSRLCGACIGLGPCRFFDSYWEASRSPTSACWPLAVECCDQTAQPSPHPLLANPAYATA